MKYGMEFAVIELIIVFAPSSSSRRRAIRNRRGRAFYEAAELIELPATSPDQPIWEPPSADRVVSPCRLPSARSSPAGLGYW